MGTNFYLKHIPTEKEYVEMQQLLAKRQLKELREKIDESTIQYHIGKRSCGWQFLFAPGKSIGEFSWQQTNPWENTLASLKEWLSKREYVIENEYGDMFTSEQFWNEEIKDCLYNDENHINGEQYDKKEGRTSFFNTADHEFTTDEGLRFAKQTDFC